MGGEEAGTRGRLLLSPPQPPPAACDGGHVGQRASASRHVARLGLACVPTLGSPVGPGRSWSRAALLAGTPGPSAGTLPLRPGSRGPSPACREGWWLGDGTAGSQRAPGFTAALCRPPSTEARLRAKRGRGCRLTPSLLSSPHFLMSPAHLFSTKYIQKTKLGTRSRGLALLVFTAAEHKCYR